ncbi:putative polysaccharide export protein [Planktothrix serta PCC 8927]|uniref:Polysaccharide export protein n=1 Tax=Planktothrix serta PCC 8927 TaxID=671068 RepID=A0A7Z9BRM8_9CYAN|nr:SLBB domain-containing protein [Planktothrix serta]VXD15816.1 putative polysaccharide export protein [Planktothrix serta PCC 8927]
MKTDDSLSILKTLTLQVVAILMFTEIVTDNIQSADAQLLLPNRRLTSSSPQVSPLTLPVEAYTLGTGDLLRVDVLDVPEYSGEYLVLSDGTIGLPLIGNIAVTGLTVLQLAEIIATKYQPYVQQPITTVTIIAPRPMTIAVSGEVNHPGTYTLSLSVPSAAARQFQFYKVTQLLQQAGGITQSADISRVKIERNNPQKQSIIVNLRQLIETGDLSQDLVLRDGDRINVPQAETLDALNIRQLNSASFASPKIDPFPVIVVGEVFNPGTHLVGEKATETGQPPTVTAAIKLAGGITPLANIREIQLRRLTQSSEEQIVNINLWELLRTGDVKQDMTLQPGDSILIPKATAINPTEVGALGKASFSPHTIKVSVVGEVKNPGTLEIPLDTTLNEAILVAGGFNLIRARQNQVKLLRLNPDGTVSQRNLKVNWTEGVNEALNPILQQNDVIIVGRSAVTRTGDSLEEAFRPLQSFTDLLSVMNTITRLFLNGN